MTADGSVTGWVKRLGEEGNSVAQEQLFRRYFSDLVSLARRHVARRTRAVEDEEDVALSAMASFFQRADNGQFDPQNRSELWRVLATITVRKAVNQFYRQNAKKRVCPPEANLEDLSEHLEDLASKEPAADLAAQLAEQCQRWIDTLPAGSLRTIAVMKLEGSTNAEIADRLDVTERTIGRKLNLIRRLWTESKDE